MSSTFTPFGLQQVVPVVNADGSIGWKFLGGMNLPEFLNPQTGVSPPDGAVAWSNLTDALGYPPEMISGGANTLQMLATYLARGGFGLQATAEVKAQDNVHSTSAALDVNGDGTVTLTMEGAAGQLISLLLNDAGNSDFARIANPSSGTPRTQLLGRPARKHRASGTQAIAAGVWTQLGLDTVDFDPDGHFSGNNFVCPNTGLYLAIANVGYTFGAGGTNWWSQTFISRTGRVAGGDGGLAGAATQVTWTSTPPGTFNFPTQGFLSCNAGDNISVFTYANQGGTVIGGAGYDYISNLMVMQVA